jgi:hypothetical protein
MMKRMKNMIKTVAAVAAAMLPLLSGCMADGPGGEPSGEPVDIATRVVIGDFIDGELVVGSMRIIAIGSDGNVAFNELRTNSIDDLELTENPVVEAPSIGDFLVTVYPGSYDFWAVMNETAGLGLAGVATLDQLEAIRLDADDLMDEESMICIGKTPVTITPEWSGTVNIPITRAATKLTVRVRKLTDNPLDSFTITDAGLANLPLYHYLVPGVDYDGALAGEADIYSGTGVQFTENGGEDDFTEIVTGHILPEYLMVDPNDDAQKVNLVLEADYTTGEGSQFLTDYDIILPFQMVRGTHYIVNVTIHRLGGFDYYITYTVAEWETIDGGVVNITDEVITTSSYWEDGTEFEDPEEKTVVVRLNGNAVFRFILANPTATWTAHLTDNTNFAFDEVNGVSTGVTREGFPHTIIIRPVGEVSLRTETEFYITVNNGVKTVEVDLDDNTSTGPGQRYVIVQTPN